MKAKHKAGKSVVNFNRYQYCITRLKQLKMNKQETMKMLFLIGRLLLYLQMKRIKYGRLLVRNFVNVCSKDRFEVCK